MQVMHSYLMRTKKEYCYVIVIYDSRMKDRIDNNFTALSLLSNDNSVLEVKI
jgi:hypothetical protein